MTIALIAHDSKKELMVQFCTAYCRILSQHKLVATGTTGKLISEATGLQVQRFLAGVQGGDQQIASRIACNEIDLLLFFRDPINAKPSEPNEMTLLRLCDVHNIPMATNIATAEVLIHGLERGDLDWRDIVHPPELKYVKKGSAASYRCGASFLRRKRLAQNCSVHFKILCHLLHISGGKLAQGQQQPGKGILRQRCQCGALVQCSVHSRADGVHTIAAQLHSGVVPGGNVLDAQLVGSGQQGGKPGVVAAAQHLGGLVCQCFCLEHDALNAKSLGSLPCGCGPRALVSGQLHHSPGHAEALLLQNAYHNAAIYGAVHADKHLVLCFVGVEPVAGQKCVAHVPCLPPCALLCATASWSQRSFSGWPAWPLTQT